MGRLSSALAVFVCGFLIVGSVGALAKAGPGKVDRDFGKRGLVVQPGPWAPDGPYGPYGEDMAVGPEDAIFLLQSYRSCARETCSAELYVQRYTPDGVLDTSFGENGSSSKFTVATLPTEGRFYGAGLYGSLAVNPRGEPVVAATNGGDVTLLRFDRSGEPAGDFGGGDGVVTTDFGADVAKPQLAVSREGRIVVATEFWRVPEDGRAVILTRYTPEGDLDPSFGAGTPESTSAGWLAIKGSGPSAFTLSRGGGIVLAGRRCCSSANPFSAYVGRRKPDGRLLAPYTSSSPWRYLKVGTNARVRSVVALPKGKIYLVGNSSKGLFAARILASGRLDPTFGRAGVVRLKWMAVGVSPALADRAGRLYLAGRRSNGEAYMASRALVARLTRDGRLDRRWGHDPEGYAPLPGRISDALAMEFQSSGRIVVFGEYSGDCVRTCPLPARILTRLFTGPASRSR